MLARLGLSRKRRRRKRFVVTHLGKGVEVKKIDQASGSGSSQAGHQLSGPRGIGASLQAAKRTRCKMARAVSRWSDEDALSQLGGDVAWC